MSVNAYLISMVINMNVDKIKEMIIATLVVPMSEWQLVVDIKDKLGLSPNQVFDFMYGEFAVAFNSLKQDKLVLYSHNEWADCGPGNGLGVLVYYKKANV